MLKFVWFAWSSLVGGVNDFISRDLISCWWCSHRLSSHNQTLIHFAAFFCGPSADSFIPIPTAALPALYRHQTTCSALKLKEPFLYNIIHILCVIIIIFKPVSLSVYESCYQTTLLFIKAVTTIIIHVTFGLKVKLESIASHRISLSHSP